MLQRNDAEFCCGFSRFRDNLEGVGESTAKIFVRVNIGNLITNVFAQVDTGAPWSILALDVVHALGVPLNAADSVTLSTRLGLLRGHLVKLPVTLIADGGRSLSFQGTFFISPDWTFNLSFLGYSGFLDAIRFAVDPSVNYFYFGETG